MAVVYDLLVAVHLLGMAALVGGWLATTRGAGATEVMVWGARAQVVTGLVLVGLAESVDSLDKDLDMAKIGVKLAVAVAAAACIEIARGRARRVGGEARPLVTAAGLLGVLNVLVAVLWS